MNLVVPETYIVGVTCPDVRRVIDYCEDSDQSDYNREFRQGELEFGPMALCSLYAKLCYKSLVTGKNANVSRVRNMEDNLKAVIESGHGSVLEHVSINFLTTNCSRVFTHELVRHRVGTAFSQTSGRYVAIDSIDMVLPPELSENEHAVELIAECVAHIENTAKRLRDLLIPADADFATKKRLTSAIRRIAPNGQANEIGWTANIRSLRHVIEMRTSRHAEWEIRRVFHDVAEVVFAKFPMFLYGGQKEMVDGLDEWTGLRV